MSAIQLRRMILDAAEYVPFYRHHWAQAGVDLTRIASAVHLEFLPVVRKADLIACPPEDRIDQRFLGQRLPGDTTACPSRTALSIPVDGRTLRRRRMRFLGALRDVGYSPGERVMLIGERPFPIGAFFLRWSYADLRLGEAAVFARFAKTRPHVLYGPLSCLVLLARRLLATPHIKWRPGVVVSTAGQLSDTRRKLLESAFEAKIADFYQTPELGLVGYAKPGIPGYRIVTDEFHVELLPAVAGKRDGLERLVVTDLVPGAMPLIRFDTGEVVRRAPVVEQVRVHVPRGTAYATATLARSLVAAPIVSIGGRDPESLRLEDEALLCPPAVMHARAEEPKEATRFDHAQPVACSQAMA